MIVFAPAKINIGLYVREKLPDGYHEIETLFYPVPIYDVLELLPSSQRAIEYTGHYLVAGDVWESSVGRAWRLLEDYIGRALPGVRVVVLKNIPVGGGMGGSSTDASAFLRAVSELFELGVHAEALEELARRVGSDCVYHLYNKPAVGRGRGDELEFVEGFSLEGNWLVVYYPGVALRSAEMYGTLAEKGLVGRESVDIRSVLASSGNVREKVCALSNMFEAVALERVPVLVRAREALQQAGAWYVSLTGSGSCLYGLFDEEPSASALRATLSARWEQLLKVKLGNPDETVLPGIRAEG